LVVVVSLVVSKAVELAERYTQLKNQIQEKGQRIVESDGFKNFQDHLVEATEKALNPTKHVTGSLVTEEEQHHQMAQSSFVGTGY
jgi:uncharacterized UPF0160 family protein